MNSLKLRIPLAVAGFTVWFSTLAVLGPPWWLSIPLGVVIGGALPSWALSPLLRHRGGDIPEGMQIKVCRSGIAPSWRWAILPDPYTTPSYLSPLRDWDWSILDEIEGGWSYTRRNAERAGSRALRRLQKEKASGRHRQAEANPRNPNTSGATAAAGAAQPASPGAGERTGEDGLETVEGDIPILAHRAAKLRFHGDGRPWASVTSNGGPFGIDSEALCQRLDLYTTLTYRYSPREPHGPTPSVSCSCGFYALPPDLDATYDGNDRVTLLVELSGRVIEHEKGYRAKHQRVIECRIPACRYCGRTAEKVDVLDGEMVQAVCANHMPNQQAQDEPSGLGRVWLTVDDVIRTLPVPVTVEGNREDIQ